MDTNKIFKLAYLNFSKEKFEEALNKDAQKNFEFFVENNVEDVSQDAYFDSENFMSSSAKEKLIEDFNEEMSEVEEDELENTFDYLYEVLENFIEANHLDVDSIDDSMVTQFSIFVVKQICSAYENIQEYYADYGNYSTKPVESDIDSAWETMKDWDNESKEFTPTYGLNW